MKALRFEGLVQNGDYCRVSYGDTDDDLNGAVHIGGVDVVDAIDEAKFTGLVTVGIADETFDGDLFVDTGWGYSEYTPMDPDVLKVGGHDLLEILSRYEGKSITVWISEGPINLLED
jgi:hypothetical protein